MLCLFIEPHNADFSIEVYSVGGQPSNWGRTDGKMVQHYQMGWLRDPHLLAKIELQTVHKDEGDQ